MNIVNRRDCSFFYGLNFESKGFRKLNKIQTKHVSQNKLEFQGKFQFRHSELLLFSFKMHDEFLSILRIPRKPNSNKGAIKSLISLFT